MIHRSLLGVRLLARVLVAALAAAACAPDRVVPGGTSRGEWPAYHGGNAAMRYSPLSGIDRENAARLEVVWRWPAGEFGPEPETKSEATPLVVNGVLYTTAGLTRAVVALDARTGQTLWSYERDEGARWQIAPRKGSGRGVAYWTDGRGDERVLVVTPGYHLVALDARTGLPVLSFGRGGSVDLKKELGRVVDPGEAVIGSSSPPTVVGDVAVVGAALAVGARPPSRENVPSPIRGYDVRTGELLWTFHTIPRPGERGNETWEGESWSYTGNAGAWAPLSADDELEYVYAPLEAPTHDYYGGHRLGDNLFSTSLVCLDARSGVLVWYYQTVHHDIWDYDNPTAPILVDLTVYGRRTRAVVQLTKQAFAYVFDRESGEPVWPIVERAVPPSDVPGERAAPSQPFPTRPAPFDRQGITEDDLIDFTPELRAEALEIVSGYRLGSLFTPPSLAQAPDGTSGTISLPGSTGGANWEAGAVDPETGFLYVGSQTSPSLYALTPDPERSDADYVRAEVRLEGPQGLPLVKPPWGRITAIDLSTGEHRWEVPNGDTPADVASHPALAGLSLPPTGKPSRAGILVTRTLMFAGEGWGGDPVFRAYDKRTGEVVATIHLPAVQTGLPMTYEAGGRQYIAMTVGGEDHPAELIALAVP